MGAEIVKPPRPFRVVTSAFPRGRRSRPPLFGTAKLTSQTSSSRVAFLFPFLNILTETHVRRESSRARCSSPIDCRVNTVRDSRTVVKVRTARIIAVLTSFPRSPAPSRPTSLCCPWQRKCATRASRQVAGASCERDAREAPSLHGRKPNWAHRSTVSHRLEPKSPKFSQCFLVAPARPCPASVTRAECDSLIPRDETRP